MKKIISGCCKNENFEKKKKPHNMNFFLNFKRKIRYLNDERDILIIL
jgi:hypothetical protein